MSKNVIISLSLLERTIVLLGDLMPKQLHDVTYEHSIVLDLLSIKKEKVELREAYAKIISADNETDRDDARIDYLRKKRQLSELERAYCDIPF